MCLFPNRKTKSETVEELTSSRRKTTRDERGRARPARERVRNENEKDTKIHERASEKRKKGVDVVFEVALGKTG